MSNSELGALRAEYKELTGKNPSPRLNVEGLTAKIAEVKAAKEAEPAQNSTPPADNAGEGNQGDQTAQKDPAQDPAKDPAAAPAEKAPKAPLGTAHVRHPEGIGCSYQGVELPADKKGRVLVPLEAVAELAAHGFELES